MGTTLNTNLTIHTPAMSPVAVSPKIPSGGNTRRESHSWFNPNSPSPTASPILASTEPQPSVSLLPPPPLSLSEQETSSSGGKLLLETTSLSGLNSQNSSVGSAPSTSSSSHNHPPLPQQTPFVSRMLARLGVLAPSNAATSESRAQLLNTTTGASSMDSSSSSSLSGHFQSGVSTHSSVDSNTNLLPPSHSKSSVQRMRKLITALTTVKASEKEDDDVGGNDEFVTPFDLDRDLSPRTSRSEPSSWPITSDEARVKVPIVQYNAAMMLRQAVDMCSIMDTFESPNSDFGPMKVRIGLHSGDVVGGIIGSKSFRYDIFGIDVLATNSIEAAGRPGAILLSETTHAALVNLSTGPFAVPGLTFTPREQSVECLSRGPLKAYFAVIPGELQES